MKKANQSYGQKSTEQDSQTEYKEQWDQPTTNNATRIN